MPTVINKIKLCETSLSDFSIEQISGVPFYSRYFELERLFQKLVPAIDFQGSFAQPHENKTKHVIEWFYTPGDEALTSFSDLSKINNELYSDSINKRDFIINAIQMAMKTANENERNYLNCALSGIGSEESDNTTYVHDGRILFGIWGMRAKPGRKIEEIIHADVLDHRIFSINYEVNGEANLSFCTIKRKYGYKLTSSDVPQVVPVDGWEFTEWEPNIPQGSTVKNDVTFIAVCKKVNESVGPDPLPNEKKFHVYFTHEKGGALQGSVDFLKNDGDVVKQNEVPIVVADEGYEFIGWDQLPEGYEVHSNVVFKALFKKKEEIANSSFGGLIGAGNNGCLQALLNWILLLLGLLLLLLLLWCFLGKCNFNLCGCDCDDQRQIGPQPGPNPPIQNPCNTQQASGGEEGYMGYFDMGQQTGKFTFEYNTLTVPDRIVIYDGKGTSGQVLFTYEGGTSNWDSAEIEFHNQIVTVIVKGFDPGTAWHFTVNCPNN